VLLGSRKKRARNNPKATRCRLGAYPLRRRIFMVNILKEFGGFKRPAHVASEMGGPVSALCLETVNTKRSCMSLLL
jgi:hypothetical protein